MVTVANYHIRESQKGKLFIALELLGELELIQSTSTGKFYATARKCTIPSTFSEEVARELIGKKINGSITRVQCDPYEYTIQESGEVIVLQHSYTYSPEEKEVAKSREEVASPF